MGQVNLEKIAEVAVKSLIRVPPEYDVGFMLLIAASVSQLRAPAIPRERLNLVVAAIVLWNTVYLKRAVQSLKDDGQTIDETLLSHLSLLGWKQINLTDDYV